MFERIVVPLDGSLTAEAVLPFVRRFLHRTDSEIILVRAVVPAPVENSVMIADAATGAARVYIKEVQERLDREGVRVKSAVHVGSALGIILDTVDEERATMIAMATHGATGLKRILLGSVAEAVLRKSPVPVFVVRPFWADEQAVPEDLETRPVRNILLPVDGSDLAELAVAPALEISALFEARMLLLRVVEPRKNADDEQHEIEEARNHLQGVAREFERKGVRTHTLVEKGDPVDEILKTLRFHQADLVVMTTHGRSGLSRLVTGSVTEKVLRKAPVPLLVVRAAKPARARRRAVVSRKK